MADDDDTVLLRARLLEGGRNEVGGILSDITAKYNAAVYHRDVEIGNLRRFIESLEQRLQDERDERLQERVKEQSERAALAAELSTASAVRVQGDTTIQSLTTRAGAAESSLADLKAKYSVLKRSTKEVSNVLKQATDSAAHLNTEVDRLSKALAVAQSDALRERKRADQFYHALRDAEGDASSLAAKIALVQKEAGTKTVADQGVREALRLQLQNTKRLLEVISYIGTLSKAEQFRDVANISRCLQVLGTKFQYVPSSAEEGPHAGILQDMKISVREYNDGLCSAGGRLEEGEPFRHLHIEVDRWVPEEAVAAVRQFHTRYFPRSSPQIFYRLLVNVATTLRALSKMSPLDELLKHNTKEERKVLDRMGRHDNRFNAPQLLNGHGPNKGVSLDYTKEGGTRQSAGEYFYAAKPMLGGGCSAEDVCLRDAVTKAWEGIRLLQRQLAPSGDKTSVSLQPSTVDNICVMSSKAFSQVFAKLNEFSPKHQPAPAASNNIEVNVLHSCSQLLSIYQGVRDAATHCDDKLVAVISDVESQRCSLHSKGASPEYTLLKHQVRQTVERYLNEIRTLIRAAHTTTLELRSSATLH